MYNSTHVVYSINKRIVTAVAHCQPVATKEYDVDVTKPKNNVNFKATIDFRK